MLTDNFKRLLKLTMDFFGTSEDPGQISVTPSERKKLAALHPLALTEKRTRGGPIAWLILFPTTSALMRRFLKGELTEKELLKLTPLKTRYDAIYLCAAIILPEYRRRGMMKKMVLGAIKKIQKKHPIKHLFYWGFSNDGVSLAKNIAQELKLPLRRMSDVRRRSK